VLGRTAHIEIRGLHPHGRAGLDHHRRAALGAGVAQALRRVDGVAWAEINVAVGRAVVAFDPDAVGVEGLIDVVEAVEEAHGVVHERFAFERPDHPADVEAERRALAAIVADVAGLALGGLGVALRLSPLPVEAASLFTLLDSHPRLRHLIEERFGPGVTDAGLAVANAVAQGLGQGPLGLVVDLSHRTSLVSEARARRRCFAQQEPQLRDSLAAAASDVVASAPSDAVASAPSDAVASAPSDAVMSARARPRPLPRGPVETYADRAGLVSLGAFGGLLVATRDPRRAAAALLGGLPKAARLGREAWAAHLDRLLASRGVVVMNDRALRRLDRIDCVLIEGATLVTGRSQVDRVVPLAADVDQAELHRRVRAMFDPVEPLRVRRRGEWTLGPDGGGAGDRAARRVRRGVEPALALSVAGRPVALVSVTEELAPAARALAGVVRSAGHMLVVSGNEAAAKRLGADLRVGDGAALLEAVEMLQDDGCAVLVVGHHHDALAVADFGLSLTPTAAGVAWTADALSARPPDEGDGCDLDAAILLVEATRVARSVSRHSVVFALTGSAVGSVLALTGRGGTAGRRSIAAVNVAALLAMGNGVRAGIALGRRPLPQGRRGRRWHELEVDDVLAAVGSRRGGLSTAEATSRNPAHPPTHPMPVELIRAVVEELANPLTPVLAAGAGLAAAVGSPVDAAIVAAVSLMNGMVGGAARFRAQRAIAMLSGRSLQPVSVWRDGQRTQLPPDALVVGDVIELGAGDSVPADCRILEADHLEVDESSLTGESAPIPKGPAPSFSMLVAERASMLYQETTIAAGWASAVVVAVGSDTEAEAADDLPQPSPAAGGVEARLTQLTARTLPVVAGGGGAVIGMGLLRRRPLISTLSTGVSLAVAAVPEGLPVLSTLAQSAAASRLSRRGALVRNPRAVEALGRIEVLCTDKTGTLTEGHIRLRAVSDGRADKAIDALDDRRRAILGAALRATPVSNGRALPHLTDRAVVLGAAVANVADDEGAPGWHRLEELPFEPARGYHAALGRAAGGYLLSVKGAPEVILPASSCWYEGGHKRRLDASSRRTIERHIERQARRGLRLLAVAERPIEASPASPRPELNEGDVGDLVLLGLLAFADPVRREAAAAVGDLRRAGVDVVMVTGDHPSTAQGIASELGILNAHRVLTGGELEQMSDPELDRILPHVSVIARVSPTQKVRIVSAFQRAGRPVGMTGDGANDAPAIRLADAGLALGSTGTPAARAAADVVITDDRIETIVDAIIEGRAMWTSVREALAILLGGNLGEVLFTVGASTLTGQTPLSTRQLLLVNLLTDVAPALAIAMRPPATRTSDELLTEGPDRSLGRSLERALLVRGLATASGATAAWVLGRLTGPRRRANTIGLAALVGGQLGQTLVVGGRNPGVGLTAVASSAVLVTVIQTPGLSQFFDCTPLDPLAWTIVVVTSAAAAAASVAVPAAAGRLGRTFRRDVGTGPPDEAIAVASPSRPRRLRPLASGE
jgi:cation-transporting ATPase I